MEQLPINEIRQQLQDSLQKHSSCIIYAPPGSGKSTLIPQFILDDDLSAGKSVIVLQPRRIATRMLSKHIAEKRNTMLGSEIGYMVRLESLCSKNTKILFLTEGILLNRLFQKDLLNEVGAIIFDEFHERHIETDICLALVLELQKKIRPDLKVIVMSATLDISQVKAMLPNESPIISTEGISYPVEIKYSQAISHELLWEHAARQLEINRKEFENKSALVFMPGTFEINKTIEAIQKKSSLASFTVVALHGSLHKDDQDKAISETPNKIIVSTNVAETSLTIPNVRVVVDSGLARVARYDARRGVNTLFVENISTSSANQRTGRAGRLSPGVCIRLWSEFENSNRIEKIMPEIFRLDLSEILLNLIALGYSNPKSFPWIEQPAEISLEKAIYLLQDLGAADENGKITSMGREMARMGVHPRYARMIIEAKEQNCLTPTCTAVAISQTAGMFNRSKDPVLAQEQEFKFGNPSSDLLFELNAWIWAKQNAFKPSLCSPLGINAQIARKIEILAVQLLKRTSFPNVSEKNLPSEILKYDEELKLRKCVFEGFVDFLAVKHKSNSPTSQLMFGKSAKIHPLSIVQNSRFMVATELEESKLNNSTQLTLRKLCKIEEEWLESMANFHIKITREIIFDHAQKKIVEHEKHIFNELVIWQKSHDTKAWEEVSTLLTKLVLEGEIKFEKWDDGVEQFINRANFAAKNAPHFEISEIDEEARHFIIQQSLYKCCSSKDVDKASPWPALKSWFSAQQLAAIDYLAPISVNLPHRKHPVKLRYDEKGDAVLSETVQALYDCSPVMLCEGKVQVVYEILAPSRRPVQITRDLEQFWKGSYQDVKKELKGRYPKHEWR